MFDSNILHKEIKSEHFYHVLFFALWASSLLGCLQGVFLHIPWFGSFRDEFFVILFFVLIICSLPYISRNLNLIFFVLYICVIISYQMCFSLFPHNDLYLQKEGFRFLCTALPFLFLGLIFINSEKNMCILDKIAILSICISFLYNVVLEKSGIENSVTENMVAAYNLLPQCLVVLIHFLYKKNIFDVIAFVGGMLILLGFGTRGVLVAVAFFGVLLLIYFFMKKKKKLAFSILMLVGLIVMVINLFINQIMNLIVKAGLSTRIFESLIYAEKVESSGRDVIYDKVWNGVDFLQMHGFAGDRFLLGGTYSHNLFLEMWYSFGLFGGTLILLSIFAVIIAALYYSEKRDAYFLIVLISFVFGQLMFSGSFLHQGWLYFLIGYSINIVVKSRKKIQYNYGGDSIK